MKLWWIRDHGAEVLHDFLSDQRRAEDLPQTPGLFFRCPPPQHEPFQTRHYWWVVRQDFSNTSLTWNSFCLVPTGNRWESQWRKTVTTFKLSPAVVSLPGRADLQLQAFSNTHVTKHTQTYVFAKRFILVCSHSVNDNFQNLCQIFLKEIHLWCHKLNKSMNW